jgi:hypothetical protein
MSAVHHNSLTSTSRSLIYHVTPTQHLVGHGCRIPKNRPVETLKPLSIQSTVYGNMRDEASSAHEQLSCPVSAIDSVSSAAESVRETGLDLSNSLQLRCEEMMEATWLARRTRKISRVWTSQNIGTDRKGSICVSLHGCS